MGQVLVLKDDKTVSFGERLAASEQFRALFQDGMNLVSGAASYLDGDGRQDAKNLPRPAAVAYAVESMRLTTRLMQSASWLLLQRAVNEGELSRSEAAAEKRRIRLAEQGIVSNQDMVAKLPPRLSELVQLSLRLQERIMHLDALIYKPGDVQGASRPTKSPVERQIEQLQAAFSSSRLTVPVI
ncbi:MAG TPA: DUF1465 family protein [Methylocella sp.]|nr:DUF1465 family protein [Methylocella sp.]